MFAITGISSCINDNGDCPDPDNGNEVKSKADIYLSLTLSTNVGGTRADHSSEVEQQGTVAENFINLDDLQLLLFDADREFLQNLRPETNPVLNGDGSYDIELHIQDKYFMDNITSPGIRFYILALANSRSMGAPWLTAFRKGAPGPDGTQLAHGTTIEELCRQMQSTVMTVKPETYKLLEAGNANVTFTPQYMPMSGIQVFNVSSSDLTSTEKGNPFQLLQPLRLLRALAKIEVVDKINYTGQFTDALAALPERIDKIELAGYVNSGNLLPLYSQWYGTGYPGNGYPLTTNQLTSPCLPTNASYTNPPTYNRIYSDIDWPQNRNNLILDFERSGSRSGDNAPVFSCYVYEFLNPATGTSINVTQPPYLNITVKGGGASSSLIYTMRLATFTDGESNESSYLTELVRNHIYRYEITALETFKANLTLTVMDWDQETTNWEYTDNIGIAQGGEIQWESGTYQSIDQSQASVLLKQDLSAAQCSFTISQPVNAEWHAIFVPIGDTPAEAFKFEGASSGTIDGNEITLKIAPNGLNQSGQVYEARLQIIVTLPDGRSMNADVCNGQYGRNTYFTIRQNYQIQ